MEEKTENIQNKHIQDRHFRSFQKKARCIHTKIIQDSLEHIRIFCCCSCFFFNRFKTQTSLRSDSKFTEKPILFFCFFTKTDCSEYIFLCKQHVFFFLERLKINKRVVSINNLGQFVDTTSLSVEPCHPVELKCSSSFEEQQQQQQQTRQKSCQARLLKFFLGKSQSICECHNPRQVQANINTAT